ncbi:MAG: hypothetical protein R3C52_13120 [Hyphomonadaceae bacterium]
MRGAVTVCGVLLAACCATPAATTQESSASKTITWTDVGPLVSPLTYRNLLLVKCDPAQARTKHWFDQDLKLAGVANDVREQVRTEVNGIWAKDRHTPNEYVCTPELYGSTEAAAAEALTTWNELKAQRQWRHPTTSS